MQFAILAVVLLCMGLLTDRALHTNAANPNPAAELIILKGNGVAKLFGEQSRCPPLTGITTL
jgi:hypothetical protein